MNESIPNPSVETPARLRAIIDMYDVTFTTNQHSGQVVQDLKRQGICTEDYELTPLGKAWVDDILNTNIPIPILSYFNAHGEVIKTP